MKWRVMLFGLSLPVALGQQSDAMTRIAGDMGGPLGEYLLTFAAIRDSGDQVMIDGACFSACTLVTALIPRDRICITERAKLGFHAGWFENKAGEQVTSPAGGRSIRCIRRSSGLGSVVRAALASARLFWRGATWRLFIDIANEFLNVDLCTSRATDRRALAYRLSRGQLKGSPGQGS